MTKYKPKQQSTVQEFIKKAHKTHNHKYSYKKVIYNGSKEKVIITCPIHGDFEQRADKHVAGSNCPQCGYDAKKEPGFIYTGPKTVLTSVTPPKPKPKIGYNYMELS